MAPTINGVTWTRCSATKKIGIIALQEAHLTEDIVDKIHNLYGTRMKVRFSQGNNQHAARVTFVLNKDLVIHRGTIIHEMIPGHALLVSIPWHTDLMLTILNIYTPNAPSDNKNFWRQLLLAFNTNLFPYPDILLGDFNIVEDTIDRLPPTMTIPTPKKPCSSSSHNLSSLMAGGPSMGMKRDIPTPRNQIWYAPA